MQVKIGDELYSANEQPIMLILTAHEKELLTKMGDDCSKFCMYPDDTPVDIDKWR